MLVPLVATALATLISASNIDEVCYDRAIVGHIRHSENYVDLSNFFAGQLMLGGRFDVDIGVNKVLAGAGAPTTIRARVVLTHMIRPSARLLIFLRRGPIEPSQDNTVQEWSGGFIPRASAKLPWRVIFVEKWRDGFDLSDPGLPPRCDPAET